MNDTIVSLGAWMKKHIEEIVLLVLAFILALYTTVVVSSSISPHAEYAEIDVLVKQITVKGQESWPLRPKLKKINYADQITVLKKISYYEEFLTRDIFHFYGVQEKVEKKNVNPYRLVEVMKKEVPVIWKGTLQKKNNKEIVAQVNANNNTYFVKKHDTILGYEIKEITPYYVDIQRQGQDVVIRLDLDKVAVEGKSQVNIYNNESGQRFTVGIGDFVEGWEVKAIHDKDVFLYKGGVTITVVKEM